MKRIKLFEEFVNEGKSYPVKGTPFKTYYGGREVEGQLKWVIDSDDKDLLDAFLDSGEDQLWISRYEAEETVKDWWKKNQKDLNEKKGDSYSYGCVMLYFDFPQMNEIHDQINEEDLYTEEEDRTYGFEDEPHVTLLYGLHDDVTLDQIKEIIEDIKFPDLVLHNASLFENKYDVLKFDIITADSRTDKNNKDVLQNTNEELAKLPHTNDFPDYHPHATIAYIKKGLGEKYTEKLKDQEYTVKPSHIVYSEANGTKTKIKI